MSDPCSPAEPQPGFGVKSREGTWARRQLLGLAVTFFLLFLGAGAFQQFLTDALGARADAKVLRSVLLAVLYGSFLFWRIGVAWTSRWLGEWQSILAGALLYALLPTLILVGAPTWLLIAGAGAWGWGAASVWVSSGTRVLHLSGAAHYGRATSVIYVGTLSGLALGLIVQSFLAGRWGQGAVTFWAAAVTVLGAAVAATLWRGHAPQERPTWRAYRALFLDRQILLAGVMLFASALTYPLLLSTFRDEVVSHSSVGALGLVVVWFHVAKAVLSYVGGWASDHWGRGWTLAVGFLGGAAGLVLAGLLRQTAGLALAAFCLGIPSGMVPVVATALVGDRVKGSRRMMALGSLFVWRDAAVVVGLIAGELLRRSLNLTGSYFVLALVLVGFALAGWRLSGTRREDPAQSAVGGSSGRREG